MHPLPHSSLAHYSLYVSLCLSLSSLSLSPSAASPRQRPTGPPSRLSPGPPALRHPRCHEPPRLPPPLGLACSAPRSHTRPGSARPSCRDMRRRLEGAVGPRRRVASGTRGRGASLIQEWPALMVFRWLHLGPKGLCRRGPLRRRAWRRGSLPSQGQSAQAYSRPVLSLVLSP